MRPFPFPTRSDEQRQATTEAMEAVKQARDAFLATLNKTTLREYAMHQPCVVRDDSQPMTQADFDYEDTWAGADFVMVDRDGNMHSIAYAEMARGDKFHVYVHDERCERSIGWYPLETVIYYG